MVASEAATDGNGKTTMIVWEQTLVGALEQLGCWLTPACQTGKLPISCSTLWCVHWGMAFPWSKSTDWTFHDLDTGGQSFMLVLVLTLNWGNPLSSGSLLIEVPVHTFLLDLPLDQSIFVLLPSLLGPTEAPPLCPHCVVSTEGTVCVFRHT